MKKICLLLFIGNLSCSGITKIEIPNKVIDLGLYPADSGAKAYFSIKNIGTNMLTILDIQPDCYCTTATISKKEVPSGESTLLTATYDDPAIGAFQHTIWVKANVENGGFVLTFRGKVKQNNNSVKR